jgi:hypothetical protein
MNERTGMSECCWVQSFRRAYWIGEIPAYVSAKMLCFDLERIPLILLSKRLSRIVQPRGARSPAKAGDAHRSIAPVR